MNAFDVPFHRRLSLRLIVVVVVAVSVPTLFGASWYLDLEQRLAERDPTATQEQLDHARELLMRDFTIGLALVAMVVALTATITLRRILVGRILRLARVCRQVRDGNLEVTVDVNGNDEISVVARSLNSMIDRVREHQNELEHQVTERTTQLREALALAQEATRAKSEFLAVMSHEIRTPLNAVIGASELLLETELDAVQRDFAETVHVSGDLLLGLINDILDFSKIEAGKVELESIPFDLDLEIESVMRAMEGPVRSRGLELALDVHPDVEDLVVGDPTRFRQVLLNLVSNAVKFTKRGTVTIRVAELDAQDGTSLLRFDVEDTGIGIPSEAMDRLFHAFEQAESSTTRTHGGTGLGLAICQRLVDAMGGEIGAESTVGRGSTFHFTLRAGRVSDRQRLEFESAVDARGRRALVVSPNGTLARTITRHLTSRGVDVALFSPARLEALLETDWAGAWDVLIVDDREHLLDTVATARGALPIIAVGGEASKHPTVRALSIPVRKHALLETVSTICGDPTDLLLERPRWNRATRVLVAEDTAVNQKVIRAMLERLSCEVTIAPDGRAAVEAWRAGEFDLILMDYQMPEMDGVEATVQIRSEEKLGRHVPIIALTANADAEARRRCDAAGMDGFLAKPLRRSDLATALSRINC
ncbi:MAG: response regulator [Planctomycetes bacterium]|nr:response regulator [Planctomycetota bacterium]